jgi:hypothetical protein
MKIGKWDKEAIVNAIMADVPKVDKAKRKEEIQAAIVKAMSPEARKLYKTCPEALRTYCLGELIYDGCTWNSRDVIMGDVGDAKRKEIIKPYEEEDTKRHAARYALKAAIMACTTLKQLKDRLPEFDKYYPSAEKPITTLPALANVVSDLSKLGWPKGEKK